MHACASKIKLMPPVQQFFNGPHITKEDMQVINDWISDIKTSNSFEIPNAIPFKQQYSFDARHAESERVMRLHEDRIPIVCERSKNARLAQIRRKKFLIPRDLTIAQLMYVIRKHLRTTAETALYLYVGGSRIYGGNTVISEIYEKERDRDGFLYIVYNSESTFGAEC